SPALHHPYVKGREMSTATSSSSSSAASGVSEEDELKGTLPAAPPSLPCKFSRLQRDSNVSISPQDYGLRRWKEYAALRHGGNSKFAEAPHGKIILREMASKMREEEFASMNSEIRRLRQEGESLSEALAEERVEKTELKGQVLMLQQQIEELKKDQQRGLATTPQVSNLQRRLASGSRGLQLQGYLYGSSSKGGPAEASSPDKREHEGDVAALERSLREARLRVEEIVDAMKKCDKI
ncbi:unnamed protein product, partial [Chrysoparadoxa australica]